MSTRETLASLKTFASQAKPLVDELKPAAVQLSPAFKALGEVRADA